MAGAILPSDAPIQTAALDLSLVSGWCLHRREICSAHNFTIATGRPISVFFDYVNYKLPCSMCQWWDVYRLDLCVCC